jgi:hypothetical protein
LEAGGADSDDERRIPSETRLLHQHQHQHQHHQHQHQRSQRSQRGQQQQQWAWSWSWEDALWRDMRYLLHERQHQAFQQMLFAQQFTLRAIPLPGSVLECSPGTDFADVPLRFELEVPEVLRSGLVKGAVAGAVNNDSDSASVGDLGYASVSVIKPEDVLVYLAISSDSGHGRNEQIVGTEGLVHLLSPGMEMELKRVPRGVYSLVTWAVWRAQGEVGEEKVQLGGSEDHGRKDAQTTNSRRSHTLIEIRCV